MTRIVLYARRNTGLVSLMYLQALGYEIKVISDDENIREVATRFGLPLVTFDTMEVFDLFLCVHGDRIVPMKYLQGKLGVNVHPMLGKYDGRDPIARYLKNFDTNGWVGTHIMTSEVDKGEVVHMEPFKTPLCLNYSDFYNVALPFYVKAIEATLKKLGQ